MPYSARMGALTAGGKLLQRFAYSPDMAFLSILVMEINWKAKHIDSM